MYSTEYGFLQFVPEIVEGITGLSVFQQGVRSMFLAGITSDLQVTPIQDNGTVSLFVKGSIAIANSLKSQESMIMFDICFVNH